ncbi:putative transcription factor IIIC subunit Tfc1/Sfc1 [Helianthus anomalus]
MADYQHVLAVHADVARKKKRNWAAVEPHFEKHGLIDADQEDLMILLPPLFSLKNTQENLVLQPSIYASQKKKHEGVVQHVR